MSKLSFFKKQLLAVRTTSAVAPSSTVPSAAFVLPDIPVIIEDPPVVTVVQGVKLSEITSNFDDNPACIDDIDISFSSITAEHCPSILDSTGDSEEKDHIPELTLYHSGESDTSMNLGNVRDFIDHIPLSIPQQDDSFLGRVSVIDQLCPLKSSSSGKVAVEKL